MKTHSWPHLLCSRLAMTVLLLTAALLIHPVPASAEDCGGPLSASKGNIIGSVAGAVGGGLLGSQFGGGAGKGVLTGLGVVGGALAGGYAGRQVEGCDRPHRQPTAQGASAGPGGGPRSCRFVSSPATTDGQAQQVEGVACLEPDGSWKPATGPAAEQAAKGDLVLRAQQRLHEQGFYVRDNVDGRWGPGTSSAVRNYQRANGMTPNGQLDAPTQTALGLGPVPLAELAQGGPTAQNGAPTQTGAQAPATTPAATTPAATTPAATAPAATTPGASDPSIYK